MACKYCGRTKQTPGRKTCDGCGAEAPSGPALNVKAGMSVKDWRYLMAPGGINHVDRPDVMTFMTPDEARVLRVMGGK